MTVIEAMNERQQSGLKDIARGIGEKLGLGLSPTERLEGVIIPEIFALAGNGTDGKSAISSTRNIEIPRSSGNFTIASMRNLDLRNVLPDFQSEQGKLPTLGEIATALEKSSGRPAVQKARGLSKQIKEELGLPDFYTFTISVKGKPQNVLYITRRGFVKGIGVLGGGLILTACADALRRMTLTPPPAGSLPPPGVSTQGVEQTPSPTPEAFRTVSIQDAVPAFYEARQLQIGSEGFYVSASSATEEKIRVSRISETQFTFGEPGKQVTINFQRTVGVGLSFGGTERPVVSHGMASILDPADSLTLKYIRQSLEVPDAQILSFVGGSGTDLGGVPLRGMSIMYSVTTPQETKPAGWIISPWLTSPDVIAKNEIKSDGPYISYYKSDGSGNSELLSSIPLKDLLVKMDAHQKLVVSSDGRYMLDNGDNKFALVSDIWRKQGVPENVISYYENLFVPPVLAEEWASDKETGQVKPENVFPLVGAINHKNRYTLDLGFGTMRLAVTQDKDLAQVASHRDLRGIVGLDLDNNLELRKHLLKIRANFAQLVEFKGKKDFKDLTLVIEGGVVTLAVLKVKDELKKYRVDAEGNITQLKKEEEPRLLPELYVEGAYIKRADTGETVTLKGLNVTDFAYASNGSFANIYERGLKTVIENEWNINLLRVGINTEYVAMQLRELDKLVQYAEQHGMYVILVPHMEGDSQPYLPPSNTADVMRNLAQRYKQSSNIMYSLFNEPVPEDQIFEESGVWSYFTSPAAIDKWRKIAQPIADTIRSVNPNAIIVVPGHSRWGREVHDYIKDPFKINDSTANIVYDIHWYDAEDDDYRRRINWTGMTEFIDKKIAPVIFGEFGGAVTKNLQSPHDIDFIRKIIIMVNEHPGQLHYTVWALDTYARGGAVLAPPNYTQLLPKGDLLLKDLNGELLFEDGKEYGTIPTNFTN